MVKVLAVKVSIIVPVYNVERYLRSCVESLLAQTLREIEIVLIDDGSTDSCGAICDEYAENDARVKVIHKENSGVSSARNTGIEVATGAYIGFVDSDDRVLPHMFERMYAQAVKTHADAVRCNAEILSQDDTKVLYKAEDEYIDLAGFDFSRYFTEYVSTKRLGYSVWTMLYDKTLIDTYHIRFFTDISIAEDAAFNLCFLCVAKSIQTIKEPFYRYYCRPASLTTRCRSDYFESYARMLTGFEHFLISSHCARSVRKQMPALLWDWLVRAAGDVDNDAERIIRGLQGIENKWFLRKHMLRLAFGHAGKMYGAVNGIQGKLLWHLRWMAFCVAAGNYKKAASAYFAR